MFGKAINDNLFRHPRRQEIKQWKPEMAYWGGDRVLYDGKIYEAKWWTQGDIPSKPVQNPWETPWKLLNANNSQPEIQPTPGEVLYPDYSQVDVGEGIRWPKKSFAPYVDASSWPPIKFADMASDLMVPYFNLGYIVAENSNSYLPSWGGYYKAENGPLNDQIKKIREMGGDVMVSFGGVSEIPLHATAPNAEVLKEQYKRFIKAYGLTRINFDIQNPWLKEKSINKLDDALKLLQDDLSMEGYDLEIWFTLPVSTAGLTDEALDVVKNTLARGADIDGINILTMNFSKEPSVSKEHMAEYGNEAVKNTVTQLKLIYEDLGMPKSTEELYSMIGVTPMIGMNDTITEIYELDDAMDTLLFAEQNDLGLISMWTLNRDKQCPGGKTNYVSISCSSILQDSYEFSKTFNRFNDINTFNPNAIVDSVPILNDRKATSPDETGVPDVIETNPEPGTPDVIETNPEEEEMPSTTSDEMKKTILGESAPSKGYNQWSPTQIYVSGDMVSHKGNIYKAKWWTKGDNPTEPVSYPWETPWEKVQ